MGLNSLSALELRNDLARHFHLALPSTLAFDYPNIDSVSKYILGAFSALSISALSDSPPVNMLTAQQNIGIATPISIDRIAHRLAAPAPNSLAITNTLVDTCRAVPLERWDADLSAPHIPHRPGSLFARFLDNIQMFDTQAFNFARSEALLVDPQQRMMLESAYEVLPLASEHEAQVGVLAALSFWDYSIQADRHLAGAGEAYKATGRCFSVASGRVSFCYGLKGPCVTVDTACSSYLSAVHLGRQMIDGGRCRVGLVTAALLTLDPATIGMLTAASMLAPDGRCKTLDASADGYVRGEACITISMRQFSTNPLAVISGSAVNQDGRSSSLTAPNGPSQQEVLCLAQINAGLSPAEISAVEMHGTGTALGDPIEVGAIAAIFGSSSDKRTNHLEFSATKSHMGHAEPAAGGVGLQRTLTSIGCLATLGTLHLHEVNPYAVGALDQCKSPLAWMPRAPSAQHAVTNIGISGFAFQGSNAHLIVGGQPNKNEHCSEIDLEAKTVLWRRTAQWFIPPTRVFSVQARVGTQAPVVIVECDLKHPSLAYLWQHQVNGRSILPGTAMFEAISASTVSLLGHADAWLIDTALHAPLLLLKMSTVLRSKVNRSQGTVELESVSKAGKQVHATTQDIALEQRIAMATRFMSSKRKINQDLVGNTQYSSAVAAGKSIVAHLEAAARHLILETYSTHPALADASTHLGAIFDLKHGSRPRVPVMLGCLHASGIEKKTKTWSTASMTDVAVLSSGDRRATFSIDYATSLSNMHSRPIIAAAGSNDSLSADNKIGPLIYSTIEEADDRGTSLKEPIKTNLLIYEGVEFKWTHVAATLGSFSVGCSLLQSALQFKTSGSANTIEASTHPSLHGLCAVAASEGAPAMTIKFFGKKSRAGVNYAPRLKITHRIDAHNSAVSSSRSSQGSTLISGGLSGIGLLAAAWMAFQQDSSLVLLGRTGKVANGSAFAAALMRGTSVRMELCDIAALEDSQNLAINSALDTIIHAAGVLSDGVLSHQNVTGAFKVFAPKVNGTTSLLRLAQCHPLAACHLFSSVSAPLGNPGQANYAAANSTLDVLVQAVYKAGIPAQSVGWGPWAQSGMAAADSGGSNLLARLERSGMGALQPHAGLSIVAKLLHLKEAPTWMAGIFNWERLLRGHRRQQPLFANSELLKTKTILIRSDEYNNQRQEVDHVMQKGGTADLISALVASIIGESIEVNAPLLESGLDSLRAVELRNSLASSFNLQLPSTVVFDYPTIEALSKYISGTSKTSLTGKKQQQAIGSNANATEIKQRVLSIASLVLGSDDIQEDQPFMEVCDEARVFPLRNEQLTKFHLLIFLSGWNRFLGFC